MGSSRRLNRPQHRSGGGRSPSTGKKPLRRAAERDGELLGGSPPKALRPGQKLPRMTLTEPRDPIKLPHRKVGDVRQELPKAIAVGHDTVGYQTIPPGVNRSLPDEGAGTDTPPVVLRTSPVADRIRAYVDERRKTEPKFSMRALSKAAGLNPAQLTMICRRMDDGADIGTSILQSVATAMGRTHHWLLHGEEAPGGVRWGDLPGWADAAAQARAKYPRLTVKSMERLSDVTVPETPASLEVASIVALAVALDVFVGES